MHTISELLDYLERFAPLRLAAEWDNVGLLLGDRSAAVARVMTCLTVTPESAAEAIEQRADLIVTHHPIFFKPVRRVTTESSEGAMLYALARAGVNVYSPHTAFDNTVGGINDQLAALLALTKVEPLRKSPGPKQMKLVVFVPESDLARVSEAMFAAGAGVIGEYRECSFRLAGLGTFHGSEASNPTLGQKGQREQVEEWRLEVLCPESCLPAIVAAMRQAHSYEEPAFDVYPLVSLASSQGEGRIGLLPSPISVNELATRVRQGLNCGLVQLIGDPQRLVSRVAIVCGAGGEFLRDAVRSGAEVLLTGEARFHDALSAKAEGITLLLPGHYATERPAVEWLAKKIQTDWPALQVWCSQRERDPVEPL